MKLNHYIDFFTFQNTLKPYLFDKNSYLYSKTINLLKTNSISTVNPLNNKIKFLLKLMADVILNIFFFL